jgi:hypothetical protein
MVTTMKRNKTASLSLRSMLTESTPILSLPAVVIQQLVGYYGDWRRSRDILNDADEAGGSHPLSVPMVSKSHYAGSAGSFSA